MDLADLGVGGDGGIGLLVDEIQQLVLHRALPHAADLHHAGEDVLRAKGPQVGNHLLLEQGMELVRRPRQQDGGFAEFLHDQPRRRPVVVVQHLGPRRNLGLLPVVLRDFLVNAPLKIGPQPLSGVGIVHQGNSHDLGADLLGQIVLRGS